MKIQTAKGYTYQTGDFIVKVGDTVILPTEWGSGEYRDTVAKLGSGYKGDIKKILGVNGSYTGPKRKHVKKDFSVKASKATTEPEIYTDLQMAAMVVALMSTGFDIVDVEGVEYIRDASANVWVKA